MKKSLFARLDVSGRREALEHRTADANMEERSKVDPGVTGSRFSHRMAPSSLPKALKRKAAPGPDTDDDSQETTERIGALEAQLNAAAAAGGSLNALADLVALALAPGTRAAVVSKAIYALYRTHVVLLAAGTLSPGGDAAARTARAWVWDRLNAYTDGLCGLLQDQDTALRVRSALLCVTLCVG